MEDLSLHILDIAENSLRAGAKNVKVKLIDEDETLTLIIGDDGEGMNEAELNNAADPFFSSKDDKRFGLGLSLLAQSVAETGGNLSIERGAERGIKVTAVFNSDDIDMKPIGDIESTFKILRAAHPEVNFSFECITGNGISA